MSLIYLPFDCVELIAKDLRARLELRQTCTKFAQLAAIKGYVNVKILSHSRRYLAVVLVSKYFTNKFPIVLNSWDPIIKNIVVCGSSSLRICWEKIPSCYSKGRL